MSRQITELPTDELGNLQTLGLDDTFDFQCKACGKCCKQRTDILLTAYDLFKIAKYLGRTPADIIDRYCEVYEGHSSHIPIVRLVPVPPDNRCPFLRNKKCSVHAMKPTICRVYPLARIHGAEGKSRYYLNGSSCKHDTHPVTVREWIGDVASDESEEAGRSWWDILFEVVPHLQPDQFSGSVMDRQQLLGRLLEILWLDYDIQKPFVPQLRSKTTIIKQMFRDNALVP